MGDTQAAEAAPRRDRLTSKLRARLVPWMLGAVLVICGVGGALLQSPNAVGAGGPNSSAIGWWFHPVERNGFRRLPTVSVSLSGVHFADANHGWAVSHSGAIVATRDGGSTWAEQPSGTTDPLLAVQFADATHGWAVGGNGTVVATRDGGATWAAQRSGTTDQLQSVHFADGTRGWAVGAGGTIVATRDAGATWAAQSSTTKEWLNDVHFADAAHGWAVGQSGTIVATQDGGATWRARTSGTTSGLKSVHFADTAHGWAVGEVGTIVATRDAGATWSAQTSGAQETLWSVHFADATHGWAVGTGGVLLATDDGGASWRPQSSGTTDPLWSVHFADAAHGCVVGRGGTILATEDGGGSWKPLSSGTTDWLQSVHFADTTHGWAAGGGGTIVATRDGGGSWEARSSGTKDDLQSLHFADGTHGWAVGAGGTIVATQDGGETWQPQSGGTNDGLWSVHFADAARGWAVGENGTILATEDGGGSWRAQRSGTADWLRSVHFVDAMRGWAVGLRGTTLATPDGGGTWGIQIGQRNMPPLRLALAFADSAHGWAVGQAGTIVATQDGGATWAPQNSGTSNDLRSVHFADATHGWAVGVKGTIVATDDGGDTWKPQESATSSTLRSVHFADAAHGWAVGGWTALRTSDGGLHWTADDVFPYRRHPAPWCWVAIVLGLASITVALVPVRVRLRQPSLGRRLFSDRPVATPHDATGRLAERARGVAAFLRNADTIAPVTVAVTGAWGTGKSSFLSLVHRELVDYRYRPVWFNAWHHQSEQQFLGALLDAISRQAVVPPWRPDGWGFRLRLLRRRSAREKATALLLLLALCMSAGWVVGTEPGEVTALLTSQSGVRAALAAHGPVLAALAGLAASIAAVLHAARAFRVNPGEAARTVGAAASIRQLRKSASFRERFASEFADVTAAVGTKRMVIFLDDLDRCTPANCAVILEAVNFLVSSGDCFVVLGLAEEPVEAAVGLAYKSMAAELQPGTSSKSAGRKLRREFAKKYLGKLVQLRVPVPAFDDAAALELAAQSERTNPAETTSSHLRRAAAAVAALLPWGFLVLVGILAFAIGRGLETQPAEPATSGGDGAVVIAEAARDPATPAATASPGPPRPSDPQTTNASSDGPVVETPEISPTVLDLTLVLWGVVFLGATGAYVLTARPQSVRRDPPAFVEALRDWNAAIHAEYGTPREHKRFLNRLRLLHVLQDPPRRIASFAERFRDWVTNRREPAARTGARLPGRDLTEVELVACGALATFRARRHKCGRSFDVEAVRSAYPGIKKSVVDETFTGDAAARWQRFDALLQETRRRK